jgi:hypothetical protein
MENILDYEDFINEALSAGDIAKDYEDERVEIKKVGDFKTIKKALDKKDSAAGTQFKEYHEESKNKDSDKYYLVAYEDGGAWAAYPVKRHQSMNWGITKVRG